MSKAFKKSDDNDDDDLERSDNLPKTFKNYVTPYGFSLMQDELRFLATEERPKIVETVRWAASNGDRSENGDYIYGKRRLREIDRRIRYLTKQLENSEIIDPKLQQKLTKVYFGATVTYLQHGKKHTVKLVGIDEADIAKGKISWISPLAKALLKSEVGDVAELHAPTGTESLEVIAIKYEIDSPQK